MKRFLSNIPTKVYWLIIIFFIAELVVAFINIPGRTGFWGTVIRIIGIPIIIAFQDLILALLAYGGHNVYIFLSGLFYPDDKQYDEYNEAKIIFIITMALLVFLIIQHIGIII